jgi:paraquat-inducible protein A
MSGRRSGVGGLSISRQSVFAFKRMGGEIDGQALVKTYFGPGIVIVLMLASAMVFFVAGIFLPFTSVTKLWLFQNQISVYHGLIILWRAGELFLFLILFVFTICLPFIKITAMLVLWLYPRLGTPHARKAFRFVSNMGKWSMLDVFVVAILVLTIKSSSVADIKVGDGFFLFFVSVMLTQFASLWTGKIVSHLDA